MLLDGPHLLEEALECGVAVSIAAFADSALENRLGSLAGRAARHQKMDALVYLTPREPADAIFVKCERLRERRHDRGANAGKWCSHDNASVARLKPSTTKRSRVLR